MRNEIFRIRGIKNYALWEDANIEKINEKTLAIKSYYTSDTCYINFPDGIASDILRDITEDIIDRIEKDNDDEEYITLVINKIKNLNTNVRNYLLGDVPLYIDENLFIIYIEEDHQNRVYIVPKVEVNVDIKDK